jgi:hypothetical protein
MIGRHLLLLRKLKVFHSRSILLQVNVAQTPVEQHLAGVQFELQSQLLVVDVTISPKIEESIIEICEGLFKVTN